MNEQEKLIYITTKEKKYILDILKGYKRVLEEGYRQLGRKKPYNSTQLAAISTEIRNVGALMVNLKNK